MYKGLRAVYWCMHDETALAEAEVEYENHTSPTVWVKYALLDDPAKIDPALAGQKVSTIIWTTTPWTLPASMAVAFHPHEEYVAHRIWRRSLHRRRTDWPPMSPRNAVCRTRRSWRASPAARWSALNFQHPFLDRKILGVLADYVTMDTGTGVVHTAPSHGAEDFATGVKYGLDATSNVDEKGIMRNGLPEYDGLKVWDANAPIIELLKKRGALLHYGKARALLSALLALPQSHHLPRHRAVVHLDGSGHAGRRHPAQPHSGRHRESEVGPSLGQRAHAQHDRHAPRLVHLAAARLGRAHRCFPVRRLRQAAERSRHQSQSGRTFRSRRRRRLVHARSRCDSSRRHQVSALQRNKLSSARPTFSMCGWSPAPAIWRCCDDEPGYPWPSDLYLEGGDQYRGWFQSSLLCAMGTRGSPPYHGVVTPGWTLDEKGQAMSKSRGNDVDPVDIASRLGGEIVRLWVASVDFREDVVGSEQLMQRVAESYRKIRNSLFRYVLSNLHDFDPQQDAVPFDRDGHPRSVHAAPDRRHVRGRHRAGTTSSPFTRSTTA